MSNESLVVYLNGEYVARAQARISVFDVGFLRGDAVFDTFGVIDATAQGGPGGATQILVYQVYYDGVKAADLGGSSAQSVILMAIVIALTVVQFRYIERKVQY